MVRVTPGALPANVIVAPNSPSARAHARTAPPKIPGAARGTLTRMNVCHRVAPELDATSSYVRSVVRMVPSTVMTRNGNATNVCAITTATVLNGMVMPRTSSSVLPMIPFRPNAVTSRRPRKSIRASIHASGTPRRTQMRVAIEAVRKLNQSASSSSGEASREGICNHGARTRRANRGTTKTASAIPARSLSRSGILPSSGFLATRAEPKRRQDLLSFDAQDEVDPVLCCFPVAGAGEQPDGVSIYNFGGILCGDGLDFVTRGQRIGGVHHG